MEYYFAEDSRRRDPSAAIIYQQNPINVISQSGPDSHICIENSEAIQIGHGNVMVRQAGPADNGESSGGHQDRAPPRASCSSWVGAGNRQGAFNPARSKGSLQMAAARPCGLPGNDEGSLRALSQPLLLSLHFDTFCLIFNGTPCFPTRNGSIHSPSVECHKGSSEYFVCSGTHCLLPHFNTSETGMRPRLHGIRSRTRALTRGRALWGEGMGPPLGPATEREREHQPQRRTAPCDLRRTLLPLWAPVSPTVK